jgi:hypothetical protein
MHSEIGNTCPETVLNKDCLFSSGYMDKLREGGMHPYGDTRTLAPNCQQYSKSCKAKHCVNKIHVKSLYDACSTIIYYSVQRQLYFGTTRVQHQEVTDMFIPICWYCHRNYLVYKVSY